MERQQSPIGGELQDPQEQAAMREESHDERVIREGIEAAAREERVIDDRTARYIASQLHDGQASALYSLASCGALDVDRLAVELHDSLSEVPGMETAIWALGAYCGARRDRDELGPMDDWAGSAAALDRVDEDERARAALLESISAAGVTTLSRIATVAIAEQTIGDADEEADTLPWTDAARWSPARIARAETKSDEQDRLDSLFGEIPDEEIGTVEDIGWFGLLRNEGRPGGIILSQNQYGFRGVWEVGSDDRLARHWSELQREYDSFMEATHAHSREADGREDREREATNSGHNPEIWVGSLSDYNNGRLHGAWLDATLDPEQLRDAIQFVLRGSYVPGAEEWAIMDYDDFCGVL